MLKTWIVAKKIISNLKRLTTKASFVSKGLKDFMKKLRNGFFNKKFKCFVR